MAPADAQNGALRRCNDGDRYMSEHNPYIFDVMQEDFKEKVLDASRRQPILLDVWADWCSPCIAIAPVLDKVLREYAGKLLLAKLDADAGENMKIAGHYKVRGFPTILLFIDGEETDRFTSARPAQFVREFIDRHLD